MNADAQTQIQSHSYGRGPPKTQTEQGVVYELSCEECSMTYVGKLDWRTLKKRLTEHILITLLVGEKLCRVNK